jgi:hypothetical protein
MACHNTNEDHEKTYCIDVQYGVTTAAYPTSTRITAIPPFTAVPAAAETEASNPISFTSPDAWSAITLENPDLISTCGGTLSPHQRVTNVLNATISLNYTGEGDFASE